MNKPLTCEFLAAIRKQLQGYALVHDPAPVNRWEVERLLAEIDRLRAQNAAQLEIVHAVAEEFDTNYRYNDGDYCGFCGTVDGASHMPYCAVTLARALLGGEQPTETQQ